MQIKKLNETFSIVKGDKNELMIISDKLKVENPNAYFDPLVKRGFKSPFTFFTKKINDDLLIYNGHLSLIGENENLTPDFNQKDLIQSIKNDLHILPFKPYDYQLKVILDAFIRIKGIFKCCTGSGKSLIIALILNFLLKQNKKCLLLVPNINLLLQFKNDIKSYNLNDLYENVEIYGDQNIPTFKKPILISTWQSLIKHKNDLNKGDFKYDVLIEDEVHRQVAEVSSEIASTLINTKYRFGFTGTVPDDPVALYLLIGLFGSIKTYITPGDLIERGLGTPVVIYSIIFNYNDQIKNMIRNCSQWNQQLKIIKEYEPRNNFIANLSIKLINKKQNTLILYSHTEHGKEIYNLIINKLYPNVTIENKDLVGKNCFEFQKKYHIYFINGEVQGKNREMIRNFLENEDGAIMVAVYNVMSTGINIKKLHNLILASPLKSYTTITQSLGRGMRKHESKKQFTVFDLVDNIGIRKPSGVFYRQYKHRIETSYNPEGYPIKERFIEI